MAERAALALAGALLLAACSQPVEPPDPAARAIGCTLAGKAEQCTVKVEQADGRRLLVVRHPDGGFRRFEAVTDGRGVIPADGADKSSGAWVGEGRFEVTIGEDRYVFPASDSGANAAQP